VATVTPDPSTGRSLAPTPAAASVDHAVATLAPVNPHEAAASVSNAAGPTDRSSGPLGQPVAPTAATAPSASSITSGSSPVFGVLPGAVVFAGLLLLGLVALSRAALRPPVALELARPG